MTSKMMIDDLFNVVKNTSNIELIKSKIILLVEYEMNLIHIKYNHNDKFNENEIKINLDIIENKFESESIRTRYNNLRDILKDIYNQIYFIKKYKLITNNFYYSKYILDLTKNYIINKDFEKRNNKFINDEVSRFIKRNKNTNVLLKYPILNLEYDIDTGERKNICSLYNDMIISKENDNYNKNLYYEIINNSLSYISKEDKENLIIEFNKYELLDYFEEIKEYNNKNNYNNMNINNIISFIKENIDDSDNLYSTIYGGDNK